MKDVFNLALLREIADELHRAHAPFDADAFVARCMDGLDRLELTARAAHIAEAMHAHLPRPFAEAAAVIEAALGPELPADGKIGHAAMRYMPHLAFVQTYGLDDYEAAIRLQAELTKRFTAEFSIRAFLEKYPERTYARMLAWAVDDNAHLRRLASEGTRPRLPWAPRLRAYQHDPRPVLELLELLKDDPVPYVRRSVANNLNDIAKDNPALTIATCRRWAKHAPEGRAWIVRHALRSLVKAGDRDAIRILGGAENPSVRIGRIAIAPQPVVLGDAVRLSFAIESTAPQPQRLLIDYAVHFVKANGGARPKVFKLRALTLQPGEKAVLSAAVSFAAMTTRRHFPGHHRIDALINGEAHPLGGFEVTG
ncbi:DNA alkylation repair protein [Paracoccus siganidrum]|uniref:DNA alkylation repair protein n=1 Tax=Paracoccus siganidrum TaxID=1276757 RepID=A0A418ZW80_9RHOB|nr:DNA alkylation repair protein [Paracoccus siganidrum]RJL04753.1 DNA alkylation repair protein [Paracoccus siganidrum]RMC27621.1 DNA alkylation repair protein [Paracoccus siganidrum]